LSRIFIDGHFEARTFDSEHRNVFRSSSASKRAKNVYPLQLAWLGNGIYHSTMVYRQKVELAYFSNACEPFDRLALHGSVQLNPPI
jgi:hypothetical protein